MILGSIAIVVLIWFILVKKDPAPVQGVYAQPGTWFPLKKLTFFVLLWLRKRQQKTAAQKFAAGLKLYSNVGDMDCVKPLCDDEMAIDCMCFSGFDANGTFVNTRIARRHGRRAEMWLSVGIPGIGYFQIPRHPDTNVYNIEPGMFSASGLKYECLEPMKRWRITFSGLLRKGISSEWSDKPFDTVTVQFSFMWRAYTDYFKFDSDISHSFLASAVAREKWSKQFFKKLKASCHTHYEQWGEFRGTFDVNGHPRHQLRLRGCHGHSYGVMDWHSFHCYAVNCAYLEDGRVFHVSTVSMPDSLSLLHCGYLSMPNAVMHSVTWTDMNLLNLGEDCNPPTHFNFSFKANGVMYHVRTESQKVIRYYLHEDWRSVVFEQVSTYDVNGIKGYGISEFLFRHSCGSPVQHQLSLQWLHEPADVTEEDRNSLALKFSQPACASSQLVGGKGCQLALLVQLNSDEFEVPTGFCLTMHAFDCQIKSSMDVELALEELNRVSCTNPENLQSACTLAVETFVKAPLTSEVQNVLLTHLMQVFGDQYDTMSLAVRSSASDEDSVQMSAAGQMATFLEVKGLDQISKSVMHCWASQFAFPAVMYHRERGQPVGQSSGIVIQRMAPATAGGVLFTRHPVTADPTTMIINASYGLCESVVSGKCKPDEVVIRRSWDDELSVERIVVGDIASGGAIEMMTVSCEDDGNSCCLSNNVILHLANLGVKLEKHFGNPRDIEFAVGSDHTVYLLQARPVTTLDRKTDDEIIHEFDTALATDREFLTTANVQEMMPGAATPLTLSNLFMGLEFAFQNGMVETGVHPNIHVADKYIGIYCNQAFVNMFYGDGECEINSVIGDKRIPELAIIGEVVESISLEELISYNGQFPLWKRIMVAINCICRLRRISGREVHKKWAKFLDELIISGHSQQTAAELYAAITDHVPLVKEIYNFHIACCVLSAIWVVFLTIVIAQSKSEIKPQHFADVALLLSKCDDVDSADVPFSLQKLADLIGESGAGHQFLQYSPEDAVRWLKSFDSGTSGRAFSEFMKRHGHRCIREAELREMSWETEPLPVVRVLQTMVGSQQQTAAQSRTTNECLTTVDDIKTPLIKVGRLIVQWILPKVRSSVGAREYSKSLTIKLTDILRQAYRKLAKMMVQESRLPDEDLVFFFTHSELGQLLHSRSGQMIRHAQRRRQLLDKQMRIKFPRTCRGHPVPLEDESAELKKKRESVFKVTGLPVGHGETTAKARVVTSLQAAAEIQPGEILIVPYTDVGWSPYFPLISGLVTEIGGIVAHGAVVAREYGLPCVVNVSNATLLFSSGDTVRLNGAQGSVEKLA